MRRVSTPRSSCGTRTGSTTRYRLSNIIDGKGAAYVNVLATTCQNGGRPLFARGSQSFAQGSGRTIDRLHALEPGLPIQLAETATAENGGSKAQWIREMWAYLAARP